MPKTFTMAGKIRKPVTAYLDGKPYHTYRWVKAPESAAPQEPAKTEESKEELTPDQARDILEGDAPIPEGWYVHGRNSGAKFANSNWPTQFTRDIEVARSHGRYGRDQGGSVWMARPATGAVVADFYSEESPDMDKFIDNLETVWDWYKSGDLDQEWAERFDAICDNIRMAKGYERDDEIEFEDFEDQIRSAFTPKDIVDTADAYDSDTWIMLLSFYQKPRQDSWPDWVLTPNGAVLIPGSKKIEAVNLSEMVEQQEVKKSLTFSGWKLQGRMKVHGMDISIENKKGSTRRGKDKDGHKWKTKMHAHYGYVRGSEGVDGDHVDCYVGPNPESTRVFIIHQNDPTTGTFDEDKVMLGFDSPEEAKALYMKQYDRPGFFGSMEETDIETFKEKALAKKNHGKKLVIRKALQKRGAFLLTERELREVAKIDGSELAVGIMVEMEHHEGRAEAEKIARDHLKENPDYYKKLIAAGLVDEPKPIAEAKEMGLTKSSTRLVVPREAEKTQIVRLWTLT